MDDKPDGVVAPERPASSEVVPREADSAGIADAELEEREELQRRHEKAHLQRKLDQQHQLQLLGEDDEGTNGSPPPLNAEEAAQALRDELDAELEHRAASRARIDREDNDDLSGVADDEDGDMPPLSSAAQLPSLAEPSFLPSLQNVEEQAPALPLLAPGKFKRPGTVKTESAAAAVKTEPAAQSKAPSKAKAGRAKRPAAFDPLAPVEDGVDPLDAFMIGLTSEMSSNEKDALSGRAPAAKHAKTEADMEDDDEDAQRVKAEHTGAAAGAGSPGTKPGPKKQTKPRDADPTAKEERYFGDEEVMEESELAALAAQPGWLASQKTVKKKELPKVDHSKIEYQPFRKNFYIESPEIAAMTAEEVEAYRKNELEGVKLRGKDIPKPVKKWSHCGLPKLAYDVLTKLNYKPPFAIQAQAIPVIMSGRDCIGCAKTGSGKTMAYVLPMLRHVLDQEPLQVDDGPIALILAPTRELATQIHCEVKKFAKPLQLRNVCIYGGAPMGEQINALKGGAEIVVATPGRYIDMLSANSGRVTNLRRVTYVVLDEADRMFDMGFEPQIMRIIENIRPDRQTVMFSATMPSSVEKLARQALTNPVEVLIGGRSVASQDITQIVEIREPDTKFRRLLEILGKWYQSGNIIVFVDKQEMVDNLFRQLCDSGYSCLALHGGMDQTDREYTIADFKNKLRTLMVATSVVSRGLDVKDLVLVINYTVPNHMEDYVHRVGRTGRAGNKGTAITFIQPDESQYSIDLVKALKASNQVISPELQKMADEQWEKVKRGEAKYHWGDGFSKASGFKFTEEEEMQRAQQASLNKQGTLLAEGLLDDDQAKAILEARREAEMKKEAEEAEKKQMTLSSGASIAAANPIQAQLAAAKAAAKAASTAMATPKAKSGEEAKPAPSQLLEAYKAVVAVRNEAAQKGITVTKPTLDLSVRPKEGVDASSGAAAAAVQTARAIASQLAMNRPAEMMGSPMMEAAAKRDDYHTYELEVNDYPQHARFKVTQRSTLSDIMDNSNTTITIRGTHIPPGRKPQGNERKLYLLIEGSTAIGITRAKGDLIRVLEEASANARPDEETYARYKVV